MKKALTASKTRSNRPGWSITFRHPLRQDSQGRLGRKIRRGLGTSDSDEADRLVEQMNELLREPSWWSTTRRAEAEKRFAEPIINAFFDELQAGATAPEELRESFLHMPGADEGYARVLFVGTTGAGKTTLLRQLIGSDPDLDRFPSTAPAKTTIADIEVIAADGDYRAIATFFTEFRVQTYVEECVMDAALGVQAGQLKEKIAERFLNHRDQKFRLSYILGPWGGGADNDADEISFDDDDEEKSVDFTQSALIDDEYIVSVAEQRSNKAALEELIRRIYEVSGSVSADISKFLGLERGKINRDDEDAFLELVGEEFEKEIQGQDAFHDLVHDTMELIRARFELIEVGEISYSPSGWPQSWTYVTRDRDSFIKSIRWFSSNYWPHFGRLLTPIVDGIRIKGPLYPNMRPEGAKLVLIDGQGIGHTPDDATSLTTHITRRFADVDVVLLVDNAQQPMQAAPLSVLRALAISGHEEKLAIAFTHFDQIKGQNLAGMADRRAHVMASVISALSSLQDSVGARIVRTLEQGIDDRCFMLGNTQKRLSSLKPKTEAYMKSQLRDLIKLCEEATEREHHFEAALVYDPIGISFAIQSGAEKFNRAWRARLGLASYANLRKEHWTRIKALNKRIASEIDVEYDTLRPVADLQTNLLEAISRYLDAPVREMDFDADQRATMRARRIVAAKLNQTLKNRLIDSQLNQWRDAFGEKGAGSTNRRAERVADIYETAAPIPTAVMSIAAKEFLTEVAGIVTSSIQAVGGSLHYERPS